MHAIPAPPPRRPILPLDDQAKLAARMSEGKRSVWLTEEEWGWVQAWRRAKVCEEKTPFESAAAAMAEARLRQSTKARTPDLFAYPCQVCGKYHLTKRK